MLRPHVMAATLVLAACSGNSLPSSGTADMSMPDTALPAPCGNGFLDGDETDTDCGGACSPCGTAKGCKGARDCASGICANRMCAAPTCTDMVKNATESDVDCGGSCTTKCAEGKRCTDGPDCASLNCVNGLCAMSPCEDKMLDGMETDVDCGGPVCMTKCGDGKMCVDGTDCASGMCVNQLCKSNCPAGMGDCDGDLGNGCETNTNTDAKNCGACGMVCPNNTPVCQGGACIAATNALLIGTEDVNTRLQELQTRLMATGAFHVIDVVNAHLATPSLQQLKNYQAVLLFSDQYPFLDAAALGDNLASFYDGGGQVVVANWANNITNQPGWTPGGAFGSKGYMLVNPTGNNGGQISLGVLKEPNSPLLRGVQAFAIGFSGGDVQLTNAAVVVAEASNGAPLIIRGLVKGRNRVDLNFLPIPSYVEFNNGWTGDGAAMIKNALFFR